MDQKELSAAEKLELHNLVALAKSARDKQQAGKPLTKKEIAAVAELQERQNPQPKPGIDPAAIVRLIVAMEPTRCDEDALRSVLGDAASKSLTEVAGAFGVSHATVKHTWRANGMPGDGRGRVFPWADVLIWWMTRNASADKARGKSEYTERKQIADAIAAEIDAQRKEFELKKARGEFIEVALVRAELASVLSACRDNIMAIPQKVKPMLPAKVADDVALDTERYLAAALESLADKLEAMAPTVEGSDDED